MYRILLATIALIIFSCDKSSTAPTDCFGTANGTAAVDDCGVCAGGTTGKVANADKDCDNVCNGGHEIDVTSGTCSCDTGVSEDCAGVCGGSAVLSGCDNVCNSTAVEDDCGICGGDGSSCGPPACLDDCPSYELAINCIEDDECPMGSDGLCTIMSSWGGDNCLSDCSEDELSGIMEFVNECTACLTTNSCEELFEDDDDESSDDYSTECRNCLDLCSELEQNSRDWCLDTPSSENGCSDICPGN